MILGSGSGGRRAIRLFEGRPDVKGSYRALAPTHLSHAHGLMAARYRELVGLRPRHSLCARDLIKAHGARLRTRIAAEPRLQVAMAKGRALAQRGELQREARARLAERPTGWSASGSCPRVAPGSAAPAPRRFAIAARTAQASSRSQTWPPTTLTATTLNGVGSTRLPRSCAAPRARRAVTCAGLGWEPIGHAHTGPAGVRVRASLRSAPPPLAQPIAGCRPARRTPNDRGHVRGRS